MLRLRSFISPLTVRMVAEEWRTVYVPLSSKEIPVNQLDEVIRGWFHPELGSVTVYEDLEEAMKLQQRWTSCERYPYSEAVRVIVELQVPSWLIEVDDDGISHLLLSEGMELVQFQNILITAKCVPGHSNESHLHGDLPFDGSIHEVINIE